MKKLSLIIFLMIIITACKPKGDENVKFAPPVAKADMELAKPAANNGNGTSDYAPADKNDDDRVAAGYENAGQNNTVNDNSKKITKEGTIEFETDNLIDTRKKILYAVKKYGGYLDEDNQSTNGEENRKEYKLKIRIPANNFDFLLDSVSETADKIDSKNISITDVTTQFIDVTTRLNNKKALEKRYLELLSKGSKISDLLEIENKLTEIRSDIESTQGQLNYLNKQVSFSSLDITFYTKQTTQVNSGDGFGYKIKTALSDGWDALQSVALGIIGLWPLWLAMLMLFLAIKFIRKRRAARQ